MNVVHQYSNSSIRRQTGLTLVEILLAFAISAFLIAGVIQLLIGSKQTYRSSEGLSRIQENGRLALEMMARNIRMAGFYPRITTTVIVAGPSPIIERSQSSPPGWPSPPSIVTPGAAISGDNNGITLIWFNNEPGSACPAPGFFCSRSYTIGPRPAGAGAPPCPGAVNSLFIQQDGDPQQELVEGVQLMRIFYRERTSPWFVPPSGVVDWNNVVSIQIHLLLVSLENNLVTAPQTVVFPDDAGNPSFVAVASRCLGQVFSTTVAVRNPL